MKISRLLALLLLPLLAAACRQPDQAAAGLPASTTPARMNMTQMMRAFPFPHANVLFDAQGIDPDGPEQKESMSFSLYRWVDDGTYAGWGGVEASALALADMAPLLLVPRACANGNPAPVDQQDWKDAVQGLVAAGEAAHRAALTRDLDEMVEVSGTLANACAACHDVYRDGDLRGRERCRVPG